MAAQSGMTLHVVQVNLNHAHLAHDLLDLTVVEKKIDVVLASETLPSRGEGGTLVQGHRRNCCGRRDGKQRR